MIPMIKKKYSSIEKLFNLKKKIIIITGCNGQIGSVLTNSFLNFDCKVIGIDKSKFSFKKKNFFYYNCDLSDPENIKKCFKLILKKFKNIDCLINNAGIAVFKPFEERTISDLDEVFNINLKSYFLLIREFSKQKNYKKIKKSIINISSIYSIISPDPRIYSKNDRKSSEIYGATKAAVNQMTRYFSVHLSNKNIRVNSISPGGLLNEKSLQNKKFIKKYSFRNPMGRMGYVNEIIGAAVYLVSDASSYTNGHNLVVDGGMSAW